MNLVSGEFPLWRARIWTFIALVIVVAAIALANCSSETTVGMLSAVASDGSAGERAFGWPLAWYWRGKWQAAGLAVRCLVSRRSAPILICDLAIWIVMLAAITAGCEWLVRRYRPRLGWRPRITTLLVVAVVAAPTALANLSFDIFSTSGNIYSAHRYGWPLIWYRDVYVWGLMAGRVYQGRYYSAAALAGNLLLWMLLLGAVGLACEWLLRRYRPRFRWSLKTMLAGVGLLAALCAWGVALRNRADEQDALFGDDEEAPFWVEHKDELWVERCGPEWLDVVGADRFRRRIVGAWHSTPLPCDDEFLARLARLPSVRFLVIDLRFSQRPRQSWRSWTATYDQLPFAFGSGLAEMRQLRMLSIDCQGNDHEASHRAARECLAAVARLTQLRRLRLSILHENHRDLKYLSALANLESLVLNVGPDPIDENAETTDAAESHTLAHLPVLPRLESLALQNWEFGDADLARLAGFPRLKSLDLSCSAVSGAGLAKLAPSESLEELVISEDMATATGLESLAALKHLKAIHIDGPAYSADGWMTAARRAELAGRENPYAVEPVTLKLDDGYDLVLFADELDALRRALATLRHSHPGIVIDGYGVDEDRSLGAPWYSREPYPAAWFQEVVEGRSGDRDAPPGH